MRLGLSVPVNRALNTAIWPIRTRLPAIVQPQGLTEAPSSEPRRRSGIGATVCLVAEGLALATSVIQPFGTDAREMTSAEHFRPPIEARGEDRRPTCSQRYRHR
jgi:hypothetical protein